MSATPPPLEFEDRDNVMEAVNQAAYFLAGTWDHYINQNSPRSRRACVIVKKLAQKVPLKDGVLEMDERDHPNDRIEDLIPPEPNKSQANTATQKRIALVEELATLSSDITISPPLSAAEYYEQVLQNQSATVDTALVQLFRGYKKWSPQDLAYIKALLPHPQQNRVDFALERFEEASTTDSVQFLVCLNGDMEKGQRTHYPLTLANTILENGSALVFGRVWNQKRSGGGGRKRMNEYYVAAYRASRPEFNLLAEDQAIPLMQEPEHVKALEEFKKENSLDVGARNRLWRLFNVVGFGVLVSPYWNVNSLRKGSRSQSVWSCVNSVLNSLKTSQVSSERHEYTYQNFYRLLNVVDPDSARMLKWLKDELEMEEPEST